MTFKRKRTQSTDKPFLFVNEDFNTLFGASKDTSIDRDKQSHVQRQSYARRKRAEVEENAIDPTSSRATPQTRRTASIDEPTLSRSYSDSQILTSQLGQGATLARATGQEGQESNIASASNISPLPGLIGSPDWNEVHTIHPNAWTLTDHTLKRSQSDQTIETFSLSRHQTSADSQSHSLHTLTLPPGYSTSTDAFSWTGPLPDPFQDRSAALAQWAPPLMKYFTTVMIPEMFYTDVETSSLRSMRHVEGLHTDMRSCMRSPHELYAMLAFASCYALSVKGRLNLPGIHQENAHRVPLLFKQMALESLRRRLSLGAPDLGTVLAVHRMVCAAQYSQNFGAVETHYKAAINMLDDLGGLSVFDDFQKDRLIMHDILYSIDLRTLPKLNPVNFDPGPLPYSSRIELARGNIEFDSQSRSIRSMAEEGKEYIHPGIVEVIKDIFETQSMAKWLRSRPYQARGYQWLFRRRLALAHKLISMSIPEDDDDSSESEISAGQQVVRSALLYYILQANSRPEGRNVCKGHLEISVRQLDRSRAVTNMWFPATDLLLWCVVMLGMCLCPFVTQAGQQGGNSEQVGFQHTLGQVGRAACELLRISSTDQLYDKLKDFFWEDGFMDAKYHEFVKEVLDFE